jgi:hypothetical protein
MKCWRILVLLFAAALMQGCSDRLADMQNQLSGVWVLQKRQLNNGTVLEPPYVTGAISWVPISSRKAHVTLNYLEDLKGDDPRRFNYSASTYEISTSAITRARHVLIRQGYRSSAEAPMSVYSKAKKVKGKITVEDNKIEIAQDGSQWVFEGNTMTASYDGAWVDTWTRMQ